MVTRAVAFVHRIKNNKPDGNIEQTESHHHESHHGTAPKGYLQTFVQSGACTMGCTGRSISSGLHAKESCQTREESAGKEGKGHPWILHLQHISHEGENNGENDEDGRHHLVLLLEVSHSTLSYMLCDFFHSVCTFILFHHGAEEEPCHSQCHNAGYWNEPKY